MGLSAAGMAAGYLHVISEVPSITNNQSRENREQV